MTEIVGTQLAELELRDVSKIELSFANGCDASGSEEGDRGNDGVDGGSRNGSVNGGGGGSTKGRPTNLSLKPFKLQTVPENGFLEPDESASTSSAASSITNRYCKRIDIGFSDLSYSVKTGIFRRETRSILRQINGEFNSGELTAILGPSGAGKSSLMNILAGYTTKGVTGSISINGRPRDAKKFRRQSAYIMQDHDLQPMLTVMEAMYFSVNLKVGEELSQENKKIRIKEILKALGIEVNKRTLTGHLSGGQKKRLAIALELVNNPPVMFFDEPTSGLDSSTSMQCICLLRDLAREGKTIICTIHQPSALLFEKFDLIFTVAGGECIYTGAVPLLISVLSEVGLKCPEFHNPADYLLEIATDDYGKDINPKLVEKMLNGKYQRYRIRQTESYRHKHSSGQGKFISKQITTDKYLKILDTPAIEDKPFPEPKKPKKILINPARWCKRDERYSTSFLRQFYLLVMRTFLILKRDKSLTTMRLIIHISMAPIIGTLYYNIGNDATNAFNNFNYIFFSIMFLMYTAFSSMAMAFPVELPIITREHFNRWYSLRVYYLAMTLADAPIQICCTLIYTCITYWMTAQPLEFYRMGLFFGVCLMVAFVAQGLGLIVGALFNVKNGAIFGPFFICPFLIFSGFFIHLSDAHAVMHWLFHISFLKYALEGAALAIFGYDRPKMDCDIDYCHFVKPKKFMKEVGMDSGDYVQTTIALLIIFVVFRVMAFYIMSYRLRNKR